MKTTKSTVELGTPIWQLKKAGLITISLAKNEDFQPIVTPFKETALVLPHKQQAIVS